MLKKPPHGLFITGTDTEIGKTYVATMIVKSLVASGHRVGVYKPVASDCIADGRRLVSEDAVALWEAAGRPLSLDAVCPNRFQAPLAPHLAARSEGRELDPESLRRGIEPWADECDVIVVEGAGGLMSPISDDEYFADLAYDFGYPAVVVVPNVIGAIHQSLSTLIAAACFRDGLPLAGIVLNDCRSFDDDPSTESNREEIACRALAPVLTRLRNEGEAFDDQVDWMEVARNPANVEAVKADSAT